MSGNSGPVGVKGNLLVLLSSTKNMLTAVLKSIPMPEATLAACSLTSLFNQTVCLDK